jgi:hypothetical protein
VPFHDDRLPVHARDVFTCHSALPSTSPQAIAPARRSYQGSIAPIAD